MKKLYDKYGIYISLILLVISLSLIVYIVYFKKDKIIYEECKNIVEQTNIEEYYVDIKGEVVNPGVYKVDNNLRTNDVITIAGGLTNNADISLLNLSKKIVDEMNIKIYSKEEVKNALKDIKEPTIIEIIKEIEKECICPDNNDACINEEEKESTLININTATKEELMTITGIGESKANSIIEYRKTNKFNIIDDIKNVSGIGDSVFENIKNYITV